MSKILSFQLPLRPALPVVFGCKDYQDQEALLRSMDHVLRVSGVEAAFLRESVEVFEAEAAKQVQSGQKGKQVARARQVFLENSSRALRCTILLRLTGKSYRGLSLQLGMSVLYRWFVGMEELGGVKVPGKSTLQRYAHWLPEARMNKVLDALRVAVGDPQKAACMGLEEELDMGCAWVDVTCVKACMHFPTDWVLLRDAVKTITKSILMIRRHGLCHRIPPPESFLHEVNVLSMRMVAAGRRGRPGGKKERKLILRQMKKLTKTVEAHGRRYRRLLDEHWQESDLQSRGEADVILRRMDNVLGKLPEARRQAHERIIGGRLVSNKAKLLSLYQSDVHVIVRGKAGAETEFGNGLFLAESKAGFIIDHELRRERPPDDGRWLRERLDKIKVQGGCEEMKVCADRGFDSAATTAWLKRKKVGNAICPRRPQELKRRGLEDPDFSSLLRRRAGTEARIAIVKNVFLDGVPRAKGYERRAVQVAWAVLTHNIWLVARLSLAAQAKEKLLAA